MSLAGQEGEPCWRGSAFQAVTWLSSTAAGTLSPVCFVSAGGDRHEQICPSSPGKVQDYGGPRACQGAPTLTRAVFVRFITAMASPHQEGVQWQHFSVHLILMFFCLVR